MTGDTPLNSPREPDESSPRSFHRLYSSLFESASQALAICELIRDEDGAVQNARYLHSNRAFEAVSGLSSDELCDSTLRDVAPNAWRSWLERCVDAVETGRPSRIQDHTLFSGQSLEVELIPLDENHFAFTLLDCAERYQLSEALRRSDTKYQKVVNSIDVGFAILETLFDENDFPVDYRLLELNPHFERLTGISTDEALSGKTIREVEPDLEPKWWEIYGHVGKTGEPLRFIEGSDALGRWFDVYAFRIEEPEKRRVALLYNDITEQKLAEQERERLLREVETERRLLSDVFEHAPSYMAILHGPDHVFVRANEAYRRLVGYREVLGKPVREALPEVEGQGFVGLLDHVLASGETHTARDAQARLQNSPATPDLEDHVLDYVFQAMRDSSGEITGVFIQGIDLTERYQAELAVLEGERRFRTLIETVDEGFVLTELIRDEDGAPADILYTDANAAAIAMVGEDLVGMRASELSPDFERYWFEIWGEVARTGESRREELYSTPLQRWLNIYVAKVEPDNPDSTTVMAVFHDVTQRREQEEAMQRARREAEEAVRVRDEFLSIASHELRNPLANIKASAQLLKRMAVRDQLGEPRGAQLIDSLVDSSDRMAALVDDLLDVSLLRSGRIRLDKEPCDLAVLLRDCISEFEETNETHRIRLSIDGNVTVHIDPDRIRQVITNLLDNAHKYSPGGEEIEVSLAFDEGSATVSVRDRGIGLPKESLDGIFEPFGRAENAAASNIPGMGLGLYICRRIVEAHGGKLWADSKGVGRGTIFCLSLPIEKEENVEGAPPDSRR